MKVFTRSRRAVDAQRGGRELLLINHPLDCPICDQGGECELQDLAMGYGRSVSRFTERKRVVKDKNVGPLIQTDMTRCIHCTRCVRFLDEIAGTNEMGGTGRADYLEITTGVERGIVSELSGNIIDLCPVGALTNKPFRYSARAWEMIARPAIAAHDGLGSTLHYHVRQGRIMRAVPRENEAVNETWLADRDRYSHFGLYAADRVLVPMVKRDGEWQQADWDTAIEAAAGALKGAVEAGGGDALGVLMSPSATDEDYFLAQRLARGLGSHNIDHRLRETDFRDDQANPGAGFEMPLDAMAEADAVLLVGCHARNEAPILGHRVRQAQRAGATVGAINPFDWNLHFHVQHPQFVPPQQMVGALAAVLAATDDGLPDALSALADKEADADAAKALAKMLGEAKRGVIVVGQAAASHAEAAALRQLARALAKTTGAALNVLPHGGNPAGAWRCGAVPHRGPGGAAVDQPGRNVAAMLAEPRKVYLLWGFEHDFDTADPA
ncbi:MAG: molybdopterin-dependent oxidoreductase, partial [Xanthomonadales bacterium]|nr:molybdopterin-dependent oxidoreductase [Xanthomonadales bacterium]